MPVSRLVVFLAVVGGGVALIHFYLWKRLVVAPAWPAPWRGAAGWALVALAASIVLGLAFSRALPRALVGPVVWTGHVWLAAMFYLLFLTAVADVGVSLFGRTQEAWRVAATAVAGVTALACVYGLVSAARPPDVVRVRVPVRGLDPRLESFRIVQISDIHVEWDSDREFLARTVATVNSLEPDLVAVTGDLVDGTVAHLSDAVEPLRGLRARHGAVFVTGNHEFYSGADAWCAHVASMGIRVLRGARWTLDHDGAALDVAGVDDPTAESFGRDPPRWADLVRAPDRPLVLLAHQPNAIPHAESIGADVQLSGHTHGGQLAPFGLVVRLAQPAVAGLSRHGGTTMYVSRGTGTWGPRMRVFAPAEITVVELTRDVAGNGGDDADDGVGNDRR